MKIYTKTARSWLWSTSNRLILTSLSDESIW